MSFGRIKTQADVIADQLIKKQVSTMIAVVREECEAEKQSSIKEYNAEVKGWTYDHLFIKVTDSDGYLTGRDNWRDFEVLVKELRDNAIVNGYRDIKINMTFV